MSIETRLNFAIIMLIAEGFLVFKIAFGLMLGLVFLLGVLVFAIRKWSFENEIF